MPPHNNNYLFIAKYTCFVILKVKNGENIFLKLFEIMIYSLELLPNHYIEFIKFTLREKTLKKMRVMLL